MISVSEARRRILAALPVLPAETVGLAQAAGRVLAESPRARVTQPWADLSAMDGYAVRAADTAGAPATLTIVAEIPAGQSHEGTIADGSCARIFTGAPLPAGTDAIVIQEDTERDGDRVLINRPVRPGTYVRPRGLDFRQGDPMPSVDAPLSPRAIGLAAAMNLPWLRVHRRPVVAILATGDEIVQPGDPIGPNQITSSNAHALGALIETHGGIVRQLGIAPDDASALRAMAQGAAGADLLLTTGGASVGDHDLVHEVLGDQGLAIDFWKIAMRPGKPLMFGTVAGTALLGLPGNPVSSLVCGLLFVVPCLRRMQGLTSTEPHLETGRLALPLAANDRREDYLRACVGGDGATVRPASTQDSSMMATLAASNCLIRRAPHAAAAAAGDTVAFLPIDGGRFISPV